MHPDLDRIINLDGFQFLSSTFSKDQGFVFYLAFHPPRICPFCGSSKLWARANLKRTLRHWSFGTRKVTLVVHCKKLECTICKRFFHPRLPGVLPFQRNTEMFKKEVVSKHHRGITQAQLAADYALSSPTIEKWYKASCATKIKELNDAKAPRVLGIDEHFFTRKKGYATTLANLSKGTVFDVTLGRSELALRSYLTRLKGKENTRVVLMDLSETYRSIVSKYFTNALIVADRFHVIRLINQYFLKTWAQFDEVGRKNRGLLSLMRRHSWNLKPQQKVNLDHYFNQNPAIGHIYDFKQRLCQLMLKKKLNQRECKLLIPEFLEMIQSLNDSPIGHLRTLGKTIDSWKIEICRMWRFTKTNSITEGLHNKMEMISRRAFGFKNFENYRVRVLAHCGGLKI